MFHSLDILLEHLVIFVEVEGAFEQEVLDFVVFVEGVSVLRLEDWVFESSENLFHELHPEEQLDLDHLGLVVESSLYHLYLEDQYHGPLFLFPEA